MNNLNMCITGNTFFFSASDKTHWAFPCTEAIFEYYQQQRSWWQKH
jgi:hypothetical protein